MRYMGKLQAVVMDALILASVGGTTVIVCPSDAVANSAREKIEQDREFFYVEQDENGNFVHTSGGQIRVEVA